MMLAARGCVIVVQCLTHGRENRKDMSTARVVMKMWPAGHAGHLDRDRIEAMRNSRLKKLLAHVLVNSRFYREYYRDHGITLEKLPEIRLTDLPPTNKQIVMAHFDALVCDPGITRAGVERFLTENSDCRTMYNGRYHVTHTSGSTGSPGIFLYGRRDWDLMQAIVGVRALRYRLTIGRIRYAFIVKTDGHHGGIKLCRGAPRIGFKHLALSINAPIDQVLVDVHRFQPHLLAGYGSGLRLLAEQQLAGRIQIRPAKIISSGEPLTGEMSQTIRQAFGVAPIDLYAACESLAIGASCGHGRGIHLFDDWHCIEVVGRDGTPASARLLRPPATDQSLQLHAAADPLRDERRGRACRRPLSLRVALPSGRTNCGTDGGDPVVRKD